MLVWTPAIDPVLLEALAARGIDLVAQIGGDSGLIPAYPTERVFSARPDDLAWIDGATRMPLSAAALQDYASCIFRLSKVPLARAIDTYTAGPIFGDNLEDWAQVHACVLKRILQQHAPDEVWFVDHPHLGLDHLLAHLAHATGMRVLFLMQSRLPCKFQAYRWTPDALEELSVGRYRPAGSPAQPAYIFNQESPRAGLVDIAGKLAFYSLGWLWSGTSRWSLRVHEGLTRKNLRWPLILLDLGDRGSRHLALYRLARLWRHRHAIRGLRRMANPADRASPFVYFALHFEPESAPRFGSGVYTNQVNAIEAICRHLPAGWRVLVKENPLQSYYARDAVFFERLRQLPEVRFVSDHTPSHELVREARLVATLNGTVGYEALLAGRASVHFGLPWYSRLPGTARFHEGIDLAALAATEVPREALDAALAQLHVATPDGVVFPRYLEMLPAGHDREQLCAMTADSLAGLVAALDACADEGP